MSRDLLVSRRAPDDHAEAPGRRQRLLVAGAAVLALAGLGALLVLPGGGFSAGPDGRHAAGPTPSASAPDSRGRQESQAPDYPLGEGLVGAFEYPGRNGGLDVDRIRADLVIDNAMPQVRHVLGVVVTGLGTTYVQVPPVDVRIQPGGSIRLSTTVIPDCAVLARHAVRVLVNQRYDGQDQQVQQLSFGRSAPDPATLLSPLCPPPAPGLHVVATSAQLTTGDDVVARVVNIGERAALVAATTTGGPHAPMLVSDPPLPVDLAAGGSAVLHLRVQVRDCAQASTGGLGLEARAAEGFTAVADRPASPAAGAGLASALRTAAGSAVRQACHH